MPAGTGSARRAFRRSKIFSPIDYTMSDTAITGLLESSLYVKNLEASIGFYTSLFGFPVLFADHRMCAMAVREGQVLLLFLKGASTKAAFTPGGIVPPSDGDGHLHLAFSITADALEEWEASLKAAGISLESRVTWPKGGVSLYFRDPDGHVLELATPGLWANY
jgi:catechol 2,3-dioxygenase-like lactoylglutathione lyase family enzyme